MDKNEIIQWLKKADLWQLQANRADKLGKPFKQFDGIRKRMYNSSIELYEAIEEVTSELDKYNNEANERQFNWQRNNKE